MSWNGFVDKVGDITFMVLAILFTCVIGVMLVGAVKLVITGGLK